MLDWVYLWWKTRQLRREREFWRRLASETAISCERATDAFAALARAARHW